MKKFFSILWVSLCFLGLVAGFTLAGNPEYRIKALVRIAVQVLRLICVVVLLVRVSHQ